MATGAGTADVRAWARQQGIEVGDRGRLPQKLVAQYEAAHPQGAKDKPAKAPAFKSPSKSARRLNTTGRGQKTVTTRPSSAPASTPAQPVAKLVPEQPSACSDAEDVRRELDVVRGEVAQLRRHLDETLARLSELEKPRGLFNRPKAKR